MIDYSTYFSRAAKMLRESAIRRAGDLAARSTDLVSFAPGFPEPTLFAWDEVHEITQSVLTSRDPSVLQYGPTRGYPPLVEALPEILAERSIHVRSKETIITTGSQQGLDLCGRVFIDPGDAVLVESPTYTGAITAFGNAQARLIGVDQDAGGIDMAKLDAAFTRERAAGRRVSFVYLVPNFQNPTGVLTTLERRTQLLEWASRRQTLIVEDDPYGALYFDDVATAAETRPIKSDDREGHVIYLSSFSKTVAPGLRTAWITANADCVAKMEIAKQSADLCSSSLDQRIIYEVWKRGVLAERLPMIRACYRERRMAMEHALGRELGSLVWWNEPKGGFFLWATFAEGIDTDRLLKRAINQGVVYVPGSAFFVEHPETRDARLSFSAASPERIRTGISRLAIAVREEIEATTATALRRRQS